MTVCIAAICGANTIVCGSDRMITVGDVQYEPPMPKILGLTTSIYVLSAGDAGFQREVLNDLRMLVLRQIDAEPHNWIAISSVVQEYVRLRNAARLRRAEASLLQPLGLTIEQFHHLQGTLSNDLVGQLARDMVNFQVPSAECIFAGVDATGPHIFTVHDGYVVCQDAVAFACVGSGATHAASQFMLAQHAAWQDVSETLFVAYNAKKRSEVAPGVGQQTDLVLIGPQLGVSTPVPEAVKAQLDHEYQKVVSAERKAANDARQGIATYVEQLTSRPEAGQEPTTAASEPSASEPTIPG